MNEKTKQVDVYKIELMVLDFERHSGAREDIIAALENLRHYYPNVLHIEKRTKEWLGDEDPLNKRDLQSDALNTLFNKNE